MCWFPVPTDPRSGSPFTIPIVFLLGAVLVLLTGSRS
jgi:hypothetical protein